MIHGLVRPRMAPTARFVARSWCTSVATIAVLAMSACARRGEPAPRPAPGASASDVAAAPTTSPGDAASDAADAGAAETAAPFHSAAKIDVWIRGGSIVDGTGQAARRADVVVDKGVIAHVGAVAGDLQAARVIDAAGMVVTPGFIDAHSHGDALGDNRNFLAMGVTTLCVGQDGRSASDERVADWARRVQAGRPTINVAPFVGHATVRVRAGVGMAADPRPEQVQAMSRLVAEAMGDGAFGLTTGLEYQPGRSAKVSELVELARPVAQRGGVIMSHLRSEDDDAIDGALDELLAQGRAGARVHVAHVKVVYGHGVARAERLLKRLADARAAGVTVTADIYPYTASYTGIDIVFPDWAKPPHDFRSVVSKRRRDLEEHLRKRIAQRNGPEATLFGSEPWTGRTLAQVAKQLGKPFEDVLIDDVGPSGASAAYFVMDQALQDRLAADPHVMIGSDGSGGSRHPRGHGTFARVLRELHVEKKLLSLEEAIRKMSGLTAATIGLDRSRRGLLRAGWAADVLVFDPARVRDTATYESPNRLAEGVDWVLINGEVVRERGAFTRARPGRVLLATERR
jgi:N-acyl-D-amino-acid deacylase